MKRKGGVIKALMIVAIVTVGLTISCGDDNDNGNDNNNGNGGMSMPYICENGTPINGMAATANTMACMECDTGYALSGDAGIGTTCEMEVPYICTNGTPIMEMTTTANTMACMECDLRYGLSGDVGIGTTCVNTPGEFITIGSFGGVNEKFPQGLAVIGSTLYMAGGSNAALYTVDTTTGVATRVGSATLFGVSESSPQDLAAIGNTLYMVGDSNDVLYLFDKIYFHYLYMVGDSNDVLYKSVVP